MRTPQRTALCKPQPYRHGRAATAHPPPPSQPQPLQLQSPSPPCSGGCVFCSKHVVRCARATRRAGCMRRRDVGPRPFASAFRRWTHRPSSVKPHQPLQARPPRVSRPLEVEAAQVAVIQGLCSRRRVRWERASAAFVSIPAGSTRGGFSCVRRRDAKASMVQYLTCLSAHLRRGLLDSTYGLGCSGARW